jgi:hypothetical protein
MFQSDTKLKKKYMQLTHLANTVLKIVKTKTQPTMNIKFNKYQLTSSCILFKTLTKPSNTKAKRYLEICIIQV